MDYTSDGSGTNTSAVGAEPFSDTAGLFHTSEIRWFAYGLLPRHVEDWFTGGRTTTNTERRLDTYQLYGINDIGVVAVPACKEAILELWVAAGFPEVA